MDKWILSKLNSLIKDTEYHLDHYEVTQAAINIGDFVDTLSNWYVRVNRQRFWSSELTEDKIGAYSTLYKVLTKLTVVAAPFVPFMTEEIYNNLVVNIDKNAPKSVHLCRWQEADDSVIDKQLESDMDEAYKIVKLGRSARNTANIKNRQPLLEMLVSSKTLPDYYGNIIKEELNVKKIEFGADLSKYVNFDIKPNLPVLGKKYGKLIPEIRKQISSINQMELAGKINKGEVVNISVKGESIELNSDNVLVTMKGLKGFAFAGEGTVGIVLETTITDELKEEGNLREILSKIQNLRKESGFEVADKIKLYVSGNSYLEGIIKKFEDQIKKETLSTEIAYNDDKKYNDYKINGENFKIAVELIK